VIRLGTRASALALHQAQLVARELERDGRTRVELIHVSTRGDRSSAPIEQLGGVGVFTTALREALLAKEVDVAVHSYKDLPTDRGAGPDSRVDELTIAAVPPREVAHDVLVTAGGAGLAELPAGARLGTSAPRRIAQLRAARPDLVCVPLRGNVDTRLEKVASGQLDGVVLAAAALARLGREDVISEHLSIETMVPAPAQGALAVECRAADTLLAELLATMDDSFTRAAVRAEREVLAVLEGGCLAPLGVYGRLAPEVPGAEQFRLIGAVVSIDGVRALRRSVDVPYQELVTDAAAVGGALAADLLGAGAATLIGV
jgi:hydroxymethylbilane synthase